MKKLMNKKVSLLGKEFSVFALVMVMMMTFASAALVGYLSDPVSGDVTVISPLTLTGLNLDIDSINALNVITQDFTLTNNANTSVYAIIETNITPTIGGFYDVAENVAFAEFEKFDIGIKMPTVYETFCTDDGGNVEDIDATAGTFYCYWDASVNKAYTGVDAGVLYIQMGSGAGSIGALDTMNGRIKFQFKINVEPTTYTFVSRALVENNPSIAGSAKNLTLI